MIRKNRRFLLSKHEHKAKQSASDESDFDLNKIKIITEREKWLLTKTFRMDRQKEGSESESLTLNRNYFDEYRAKEIRSQTQVNRNEA